MPVIFTSTVFQLILCFAILGILIAVAIYVLGVFRDNSLQKELNAEEMLNKLQELKTEGKLSPEEFRIIKKRLLEHILYERNVPCPDLHPGTADPAAILLRGTNNKTENPEDTKRLGKDDNGGNDTVVITLM